MSKVVSRMKLFYSPLVWVFAFAALACITFSTSAQDTGTRGVTPEEFVKTRPGKAGAKSSPRPGYKLVGTPIKVSSADMRQMGTTIWRLRPTVSHDGEPRI